MIYLRTDHTAPGDTFVVGTMSNPTAPYLTRAAAGDPFAIAHLAQAGIVPHYPLANPDDRICGSAWDRQEDGSFVEVASGTPEQIAAALAEQEHLRLRREVWPVQTKQRSIRAANAALDDPDAATNQRIEALRTLNTI